MKNQERKEKVYAGAKELEVYSASREVELPTLTGRMANDLAQQLLFFSDSPIDKKIGKNDFQDLDSLERSSGKKFSESSFSDFSVVYIRGDRKTRDGSGRFVFGKVSNVDNYWCRQEAQRLEGAEDFQRVTDMLVLAYWGTLADGEQRKDTIDVIRNNPSEALTVFPSIPFPLPSYWNNVRISQIGQNLYRVELVGFKNKWLHGRHVKKSRRTSPRLEIEDLIEKLRRQIQIK
ncbi:hypothetical protein HYV87_00920 [Candidatus Woesearchaeota archaeon]|nr:hypothetical protein [Candidatus Woesearchaeota archaeon]